MRPVQRLSLKTSYMIRLNDTKAQDAIKKEFDSHMFDSVGDVFKTRDSFVEGTGALVNDKEKLFYNTG
ncbi:hypothetical protein [Fictibacillus solisalsi]|nr:hypothetical protein [Fictibacillus solisalsi]